MGRGSAWCTRRGLHVLVTVVAAVVLLPAVSGGSPVGGSALASAMPVVTSENVSFLGNVRAAAGMTAITFDPDSPVAYASTFGGLQVYDITRPALPVPIAALAINGFTNESFELGRRGNGEKFLLFGANAFAADSTGYVKPQQRVVTVVEVTEPRDPTIVAHLETPTRTHTVTCLDRPACTYAYTDGRTADEAAGFQPGGTIVDLRDFRQPKVAGVFDSVVPLAHQNDVDDAGVVWRSGQEGTVALDASDPLAPRQLNSTDHDGIGEGGGDLPNPSGESNLEEVLQPHHHNSTRPHARNFVPGSQPDFFAGNVLLVTEEVIFVDSGRCAIGQKEGRFQAWYVPFLDADRYRDVNPDDTPGGGAMHILDTWNTELLDTDLALRRPGYCSAHYFDTRDDGFVAMAWFEQGLRILDVRDPSNIRQVGYFFLPDQQAWDARWVPEYGPDGRQTGALTDFVYTADNYRGIDILRIDLSSAEAPGAAVDLTAPVLPQWLDRTAASPARPEWDYGCRIPLPSGERHPQTGR